ncbi:branched chain amino acid aminotransferase [Hyaloraphidium curvatum]|nr:branched chain amino acid aminotransferase [Hyaloraphidium curvatum]
MASPSAPTPLTIHCWSSPRCLSTALMYSFSRRADCEVADEPLYASFLQLTGFDRPYRDAVLASQPADGAVAAAALVPKRKPILFAKQMTKHKVAAPHALLFPPSGQLPSGTAVRHFLLVRHPLAVLRSFGKVLPVSLQESGFPAALEILAAAEAAGQDVPVVLSDDLAAHPEETLRLLCGRLGIPFDPAMLSWPAGPKEFDGPWAPYFYARTHASTGFEAPEGEREEEVPQELKGVLDMCWPIFELLRRRALRPGRIEAPDAGPKQAGGTHNYLDDPRNADIMVGTRDGVLDTFDLVHRPLARVPVFDAGFVLGDGVWEGVRLHRGALAFWSAHADRLWEGMKALDMRPGMTKDELRGMVYRTADANGMRGASGVHIRVMVTRGLKTKLFQNPAATAGKPTVVIVPEWKFVPAEAKAKGIKLHTCHVRRGYPDVQDPQLNSHSKLNCIAASIQGNRAGADESLMLDPHGFIATCNSTNFMVVRKGVVLAPHAKYQMPGITRANVLRLCAENGIPFREADITLAQAYSAEEAFVTGTFAGLTPVGVIDGRVIGEGESWEGGRGPVTERLQELYARAVEEDVKGGR